ncbi:MAG: MFS transporter, partial [Candidatus Methylomirabilales bacterium]
RPLTFGMLTLSLFFLGLFLHLERKAKEPIVPLSLFANQLFRSASLSSFLAGMAMFGAIVYIPLFVQGVLGTSAIRAGSVLTPFMLGWVICSILGARLLLRIGSRQTVLLGMGLLSFGFFLFTRMDLETTWGDVAFNVTIAGTGMGFIMAPLLIAVQNAVPRNLLGIATSASMFFRTIGGAIGVAAMGATMGTLMKRELATLSQTGLVGVPVETLQRLLQDPDALVHPETRTSLPVVALDALRAVLGRSLHQVFFMGFLIALLAFLSAWWIPKGKAQDHVRREPPPVLP